MNIEHLREFIELSRQLNFTSVAKTLHMTQPALSNHIHALEQETGVTLIERSAKDRARLTPAGQLFLDTTTQIVALYDDMLPRLHDVQKTIEGKIVVRSPRNEYSYPLMDFIYEFRRTHPHIDIVMWPWEDIDGIEDVASGAVDVAYIGFVDYSGCDLPEDCSVKLVPFAQTEVSLWVDHDHPLAQQTSVSLEDLNGTSILIPANKKHDSWRMDIEGIIKRFDLDCCIVEKYCDSLEDLLLTKTAGEDILLVDEGLLNFSAVRLRDDRVAVRFDPPLQLAVCLGYAEDAESPALDAFVTFLREKYDACAAHDAQ